MLEKELKFYSANRSKFLRKYLGKYLVIKGSKLIAVYDTHAEARAESLKDMLVGSFLIEHCIPEEVKELI